MLWELNQYRKIADATQTAEDAQSTAKSHASDLISIHQKIEKLTLCCQAMWELLRDNSDLTEEDIDTKVIEIDGRDGKVDGAISLQMIYCPTCGRPTNTRRTSCVICGAELNKPHKFDV